jgi:CheY-like chemotaxis protein
MISDPIGTSAPELITSVSHYLWPAVAAVVLWKLMPVIREVLRTRSYKINIGGFSVDVQTASDALQKQITDLQNQVAQLSKAPVASVRSTTRSTTRGADGQTTSPSPPVGARVLWVDDQPENNAYEIQALQSKGISVTTATSTAEGLQQLQPGHYFAAITDVGRVENGSYNAQAGLELVKAIRQADPTIRLYVFTTQSLAKQYEDKLLHAGANAVTSSSVRLLAALGVIGEHP